MPAAAIAELLLDVFSVVQAGFSLKAIADKAKAMADAGAKPEDITKYIKGIRDAALADLNADVAKAV